MRPAIVVMVKAPIAGFAKTRLTPPLSKHDAASLALCFVQDVIKSALSVTSNVIVAFTPDDGRLPLEVSLPSRLLWVKQQGEDLGERLSSVIAYAGNVGFSPIIVLGADSPTLPSSFVVTACNALANDQTDIVLGPTTDGGYYLLGLRKVVPNLFHNVAWSTDRTFEQTVRNINELKLRLLKLPDWYDVDTFAELDRLCRELNSNQEARRLAPSTHAWLLSQGLSRPPAG